MSTETSSQSIDYEDFRQRPEFQALRSRYRRFVFPLTVVFMLWFLTFVILGAFAPEFMATPVPGFVNMGILLGLLQFVTTFAITMGYVRFANRRLDPVTAELRGELEGMTEAQEAGDER